MSVGLSASSSWKRETAIRSTLVKIRKKLPLLQSADCFFTLTRFHVVHFNYREKAEVKDWAGSEFTRGVEMPTVTAPEILRLVHGSDPGFFRGLIVGFISVFFLPVDSVRASVLLDCIAL